jgi:hypothetical protein
MPTFEGALGDVRLEKRAHDALYQIIKGRNSSILGITSSRREQVGFYRLLENDRFSEEAIVATLMSKCSELVSGRHVLCINDTTEFNFESQRGRIRQGSGFGPTGKNAILGFFMHPCLALDAESGHPLGYSYCKIWNREQDTPDCIVRDYQRQPIEDKESYRWLECISQSEEMLAEATTVTMVSDRGSDIYDLLAMPRAESTHLLIRYCINRRCNEGKLIEALLEELPVKHSFILEIEADKRIKKEKRNAVMDVKWTNVSVLCPQSHCNKKDLPAKVDLYLVEVKERNKKGGVIWRLYTTHKVEDKEQALQIIAWYKMRWYIEQIFRLLKTDGIRIEESQLEEGYSVRKLTLLALLAALRILQMMLAYSDCPEQPIVEVFSPKEQKCLEKINDSLVGATEKLKNKHPPNTLRWATWIIARLGGWKGYQSQRKPGPIVLHKGLIKFYTMFEGWELALNY